MQHEFDLINTLTKRLNAPDRSVVAGPGDDCACVQIGGELLLISNDEQIEDRHFKRHFPAHGVGYKLIAANVSDILACGGLPKWVNLSLTLPGDLDQTWVEALYDGIAKACETFGVSVTGGNTAASDRLHIGAFILGSATRFVPRSGARPGDALMISAPLGLSRAGLEKLLEGDAAHPLAQHHLYPAPPLHLQPFIAAHATAAIDISDALAGDLGHMMAQSGAGFRIDRPDRLYARELVDFLGSEALALEYALYGGEAYQLAFTLPQASVKEAESLGCLLIGEATQEAGLFLHETAIAPKGFEHF